MLADGPSAARAPQEAAPAPTCPPLLAYGSFTCAASEGSPCGKHSRRAAIIVVRAVAAAGMSTHISEAAADARQA